MAKRSSLKDLFIIALKLPWWVSLILAVVTFIVFKQIATMEVALQKDQVGAPLDGLGEHVLKNLLVGISFFLQYLIPGIFIAGACAGFLKQRRGDSILKRTRGLLGNHPTHPPFESLSWQEFEMLLSAAFRAQGYRVVQALPGPDGGVDITLHDAQGKTLVQCKHWRSRKVGVSVVRELLGSMTVAGVSAGIVVCSGEYTQQAYDLARSRTSIKLIDGRQLKVMLREGMNTKNVPKQEHIQESFAVSHCPFCQSQMVKRKAKKGPNAGALFWGCSQFPKCRGVRAL